jgi:glyoxylase-like metal-dependent hydrolase (beta-lactamase superfamily II)
MPPPSPAAWPVGDARVTRVVDEEIVLPLEEPLPDWCVPGFAPSAGEFRLVFSALAIRAADGTSIVADPWLANDGARGRPDAAEHARRLLGALADAGHPPEEVDLVVLTHFDGIGWVTRPSDREWVPAFPRARYVVPRIELGGWTAQPEGHEGFAVLVDADVVDAADPPQALAPGVELVALPGHGPGHTGVRVESGGDLAVYAGHLFVYLTQVIDPTLPNDEDPATATATRQALLAELADRRGLLLTTLIGGPGGGRVERDGASWRLVP